MKEDKCNYLVKILAGAAFAFYFLITCYKLTNAPLWFDETIEYWYSKIMLGPLPYDTPGMAMENMYQRIISTFQPPLYNVIMFFWLKFSSSEWWFRFFGVVMGFIGNIAIYKTVKKIGNGYLAATAVFFTSCIYVLVYYWQECAEYCLMLGTLCWTIYFFICVLEEQSGRNIILFTISAILPIYSQYGAAFPVVTMLIVAYIYIFLRRDKALIKKITISYVIAFLAAAIPLIMLFLKKQMANQQGGEITAVEFGGNFLFDIFKNLAVVVRWNLFSYFEKPISVAFTVLLTIATLAVIIFSKKNYARLLAITNIITWLLYYFAVKIGFYSYGDFGNRYNLFFVPLWIITIFCYGIEIYEILRDRCSERIGRVRYFYVGICLCCVICFMYSNWTYRLKDNWGKENMRDAVKTWISREAYNSNTIVYYGGTSGFAYYLRENDNYSEDMEKNVNYMYWNRDRSAEEYTEYVNSIYGTKWPEEVYIIGTHTGNDFDTLASVFTDNGYIREDIFSSGGLLIRLIGEGGN